MSVNKVVYSSILQCSKDTGINKNILKKAKILAGPKNGFDSNGKIDWDIAGPWIEQNKNLLEVEDQDDIAYYKKEIAKRDVTLRDLEIQKAKGDMVDPKDVKKFLTEFSVLLSSVLKKKRQELMSKVIGYESVIDTEFVEIFNMIDEEIRNWGK